MNEQDQDQFDLFDDFIKTEPEISTTQTMQNKYCLRKTKTFKNEDGDVLSDSTFNDFEYQRMEKFAPVKIKEEITDCEDPKIEGSLDLQTKIDQDSVSENVQNFPKTVKSELENSSDVKVADIKREVSKCIQPKTESVVRELLTSECDLPTLKIESTDYYPNNYLGHTSTYNRKPLKNTSQVILKNKRRKYTCPICQKKKWDILKINQYLLLEGEPKPIIKLKDLTKDVPYKISAAEIVPSRYGDTIRLVIEGEKTIFLPQRSIQVLKHHIIELGNGKCSIIFTGEKDTGKGNPAALFKIINC